MRPILKSIDYAKKLVSFESTSSLSNTTITDYLEETLEGLGFETERLDYTDQGGVRKSNVVAKKGPGRGGFAYFGHTDVVPADEWSSDSHGPFEARLTNKRLYGRGSCDMKGSIACMLAAAGRVSSENLRHPIYITCTADEEVGYCGAREVARRSLLYREMVEGEAHGVVGEPTRLGIVYGHKGTYGFEVISRGRAAHTSTSKGLNANLAMIPFLSEMKAIHDELEEDKAWHDPGFDPPTVSWNIGINDHTKAVNMTPPQSVCTIYFRPTPLVDGDLLLERAKNEAERCGLEFRVMRRANGYITDRNSEYIREMQTVAQQESAGTVSFGTDACIFQEMKHLIVLGPGDIAQAHTADEWIGLEQLTLGTELYGRSIERWCAEAGESP